MAANITDIFKWIFLNENCCIMHEITQKYFCDGRIDNNAALVQIMASRRAGDNSLSELMMALFGDAYMRI